jgi:hypothetical protein
MTPRGRPAGAADAVPLDGLGDPLVDLEQPARRPLVQAMDTIAQDQLGHRDQHYLRVLLQQGDESVTSRQRVEQHLRSKTHAGERHLDDRPHR